MKHRPRLIKILAVSLFVVPLSAALLIYSSGGRTPVQLRSTVILDLWVLGLASCVAAMGIWKVRPWGFFSFFGFVLGVLSGDLIHIINNPTSLNVWDFVDATAAAVGVILVLQKHVSAPYFNPKIRWWETPARHQVDFKVTLTVGDKKIEAQVLDISESGCFVHWLNPQVVRGQVLSLGLSFEHYFFESPVKVIRHSTQPQGVGLKFQDTSKFNRREIRRLIKTLARKTTASKLISNAA